MSKTVVGLYERYREAEKAVQALLDAGFEQNDINLITNDAEVVPHFYENVDYDNASEGAAVGVGVGGAIGSAGALLAALFIPGIGPVVGVGALVTALAAAGVGAATGGVLGALATLDIPEIEAQYYAEAVRQGGTLLTLQTDETRSDEALAIMRRYDLVDLEKLASKGQGAEGKGQGARAFKAL